MDLILLAGLLIGGGTVAAIVLAVLLREWPRLPLVFLLASIYLNRYKWDVGPVNIRLEQIAILIVFGLSLIRWAWRGEGIRIPLPIAFAVGWWLALFFGAVLHAPYPGAIARHVIRLGIVVMALVVTANLIREPDHWHTLVRWLLIFGILEASWGLLARGVYELNVGTLTVGGITLYTPINLGIQVTSSLPVPVPYGTIEEGNIFGSTMGALLVLALGMWMYPGMSVSRRVAGWGLLLIAGAWLLSLSRGAWIGVLVVLPLFWILYPPTAEQRLLHLGELLLLAPLALIAFILALYLLPPTSPLLARLQTLTQLGTDLTFSTRLARWSIAWRDFLLSPLIGWGPGSFEQLHGIMYFAPAWLDSLTIKTLQEGGIFGYVFLLLLYATAVGGGIYTILTAGGDGIRGALLGLTLGALVLFVAYHATDAMWLGFVWVWLGALLTHPKSVWMYDESA